MCVHSSLKYSAETECKRERDSPRNGNPDVPEESQRESIVHRNFWDCYEKIVSKQIKHSDRKSSATHELESYCALPHKFHEPQKYICVALQALYIVKDCFPKLETYTKQKEIVYYRIEQKV